jgi:hypothetical protein
MLINFFPGCYSLVLQWRDLWEGIHGREGEEAVNVKKCGWSRGPMRERWGVLVAWSKGDRGMWACWMGLGLPMAGLASIPFPIPILFLSSVIVSLEGICSTKL